MRTIMHKKWKKRYLKLAKEISSWSKDPSTKVGAIIVGEKGRVISQGYNGFLPGCVHESIIKDGHEMATVHAEQNAISDCAKRGVSSNRSIAYITHYPCVNCMKVLCAAGINEIKYINDYNNDPIVDRLSAISKVPITQI